MDTFDKRVSTRAMHMFMKLLQTRIAVWRNLPIWVTPPRPADGGVGEFNPGYPIVVAPVLHGPSDTWVLLVRHDDRITAYCPSRDRRIAMLAAMSLTQPPSLFSRAHTEYIRTRIVNGVSGIDSMCVAYMLLEGYNNHILPPTSAITDAAVQYVTRELDSIPNWLVDLTSDQMSFDDLVDWLRTNPPLWSDTSELTVATLIQPLVNAATRPCLVHLMKRLPQVPEPARSVVRALVMSSPVLEDGPPTSDLQYALYDLQHFSDPFDINRTIDSFSIEHSNAALIHLISVMVQRPEISSGAKKLAIRRAMKLSGVGSHPVEFDIELQLLRSDASWVENVITVMAQHTPWQLVGLHAFVLADAQIQADTKARFTDVLSQLELGENAPDRPPDSL